MAPNGETATHAQIEALLNFMSDNHDMARGLLRGADGRIRSKRLWESLCNSLNAMGSCTKSVEQWQRVWADRKHLAKKAAAAARRSACATLGEGPSVAPTLSEVELKILSIIGEGFGEPQTEARVPAFPSNRPRPTYFISVNQDREKQNRSNLQSAGLSIKRPANEDRIDVIKKRDHRTEEKDEYTTYGELVAMKLRKIATSYSRSTAQYHINNILYKAEIGAYDKPSRQNKSHNSKDHVTASSSANFVDDDVLSSRSSSPDDLKQESDENSS